MIHEQKKPLNYWKYEVALLAVLSTPLLGQTPPSADALSQQRNAATAMQESLAKQRAAIEKQMGTAAGGSFFVLPRATSMGTTAAMPAIPVSSIAPFAPPAPLCDPLPAPEVESLVGQTAERDGVSPDLLRTVMKQESGFRPCAVSSKGAMGLMQLMPATADDLGIANPFDAAANLDGGARFLKQLLDRYSGDLPKALGAYNAGPATVDAAGGVPAIPETVDYVRQILAALPFHF
jgi:soluble lytic murein transglycosylase-like protein